MTNLNLIDEIAMKFETDWRPEQSLRTITTVAADGRFDLEEQKKALLELIMIDMDRRWHAFSAAVTVAGDPNELLHRKREIPTTRDYFEQIMMPAGFMDFADCHDVLKHEFVTRARIGDVSAPSAEIAPSVVQKISTTRPELQIWCAGRPVFKEQCWGDMQIGRQSQSDPPPFCLLSSSTGARVICASRENARVSRQQTRISLLTPFFAAIANTSSNRHFKVNDEILAPGATQLLELPLVFNLDDMIIKLQPREA
jgi:hypothetical protein